MAVNEIRPLGNRRNSYIISGFAEKRRCERVEVST